MRAWPSDDADDDDDDRSSAFSVPSYVPPEGFPGEYDVADPRGAAIKIHPDWEYGPIQPEWMDGEIRSRYPTRGRGDEAHGGGEEARGGGDLPHGGGEETRGGGKGKTERKNKSGNLVFFLRIGVLIGTTRACRTT